MPGRRARSQQPAANSQYTLRVSSRAKYVRLKVSAASGLVVVIPKGFDRAGIPAILAEKRRWIERALRDAGLGPDGRPEARRVERPDRVAFQAVDEAWDVKYEPTGAARLSAVERSPGRLVVRGPGAAGAAGASMLRQWVQGRARLHLVPWLDALAAEHGLTYNRAFVRNQKTRWGSCSDLGNINLNQKLLFLPRPLARYVLIHELCHTVHLNHSKAYWALVREKVPDYRVLDRALRDAGHHVPAWHREE